MKIGIIRCQEYANKCAGYNCLPVFAKRAGQFAAYTGDLELVGFESCGGCGRNSADKVVDRAARLKGKGAEVVHFGNCLVSACPWAELYQTSIEAETGLRVIRGTH